MANEKLLTATLTAASGLSEDDVVWSFPIQTDPAFIVGDIGELTTAVNAMFNIAPTGASASIGQYIGGSVSRASGAIKYKLYDLAGHLDGSPHGSPIATDTGTLVENLAAQGLPQEVALVVTTRATGWDTALIETPDNADPDLVVQRPRQRKSGRIFVGPLTVGAIAAGSAVGRPATDFMTAARVGIKELCDDLIVNGHHLCVWSRKDAAFWPVTATQTDDAFDTQRRRGISPTARLTADVATVP